MRKVDPTGVYFKLVETKKCKKLNLSRKNLKGCYNDIENGVGIYSLYGGENFETWINETLVNNPDKQTILMKLLLQALKGLILMHSVDVCHLDIFQIF